MILPTFGLLKDLYFIWMMPDRWAYILRLSCVSFGIWLSLSLLNVLALPFLDVASFLILEVVALGFGVLLLPIFLRIMTQHLAGDMSESGFRTAWIESCRWAVLVGFLTGLLVPACVAFVVGVVILVGALTPKGT